MDLQNRAGNLAKTETSAALISDPKCSFLCVQSKSSLNFFRHKNGFNHLDFSGDSGGFVLPVQPVTFQ